jgi:hypothetical protein
MAELEGSTKTNDLLESDISTWKRKQGNGSGLEYVISTKGFSCRIWKSDGRGGGKTKNQPFQNKLIHHTI